jgi:hypothetical protein
MAGRGDLDPSERDAIARLLKAAHQALMDPRLDQTNVWFGLGLIGQTLEIAAGDVKAGGRAALISGAATRLPEYLDQLAAGRLTGPFRTAANDEEGGG